MKRQFIARRVSPADDGSTYRKALETAKDEVEEDTPMGVWMLVAVVRVKTAEPQVVVEKVK